MAFGPRAFVPAVALAAMHGCTALFDPALVRRDGGPLACGEARTPPRPSAADRPSGEDLWFAARRVELDVAERWTTTGLNLDGFCTQRQLSPSECRPGDFGPGSDTLVDGAGGIDNAYGHEVVDFALLLDDGFPDAIDAAYRAGSGSLVLGLRGYSGGADDPRVEVILAASTRATSAAPAGDGGLPLPDGGLPADLPPPAWEGNDWIWVGADGFVEGDTARPLVRDRNAYVARGVVVAALTGGRSVVAGMPLTDVHLFGRLDADHRSIDALTLAGRWAEADLLTEAARRCFGSARRRLMQNLLSMGADVRAEPGTGGEGVLCDAVSVGLAYDLIRVRLGGVARPLPPRPPFPEFCGAALPDAGAPPDAG